MQNFYRPFSSNDFQQSDEKRDAILYDGKQKEKKKREKVNWYSLVM